VSVIVVIQDTIDLLDCSDPTNINQQFSLEFIQSAGSLSNLNSNAFYRSGNPGYYYSYPVLVGENSDTPRQVSISGFQLYSSDSEGQCYLSTSTTRGQSQTLIFG